MRIAVWHNLSSGGASRVLFDQASGLVRRGHHVEVWSPATADHAFLPLDASVEERVLELSGVDGRPRSLSLREIVSGRRDDIVAMDQHGRAVAEQIDQGDFDVLLANCCRFFRTTSIARQVTIPSVLIAEPLREALRRVAGLSVGRGAAWVVGSDRDAPRGGVSGGSESRFARRSQARWPTTGSSPSRRSRGR